MSDRSQRRARRNARDAAQELAQRGADIDDFDKYPAEMRSSWARALSPEGEKPTGGTQPPSASLESGRGIEVKSCHVTETAEADAIMRHGYRDIEASGAYTCQYGTAHRRCRCPTPEQCVEKGAIFLDTSYQPKHKAGDT